jgi:hypothetical protein
MNPSHFFTTRLTREAPDAASGAAAGATPANPGLDHTNVPAGLGTPPAAAPTGPDLSWAGEDFLEGGQLKADAFREHVESLRAEKAARPVPPESYDFAPPTDLDLGDLKLPEGVSLEVKRDDPAYAPLFDELGGFLKEIGAPAEAAPKVAGLLAKYEAARFRKDYDAANRDYESLGATDAARDQRIQTVQRALEGRLPADEAKALMRAVSSSAAVKAIERLVGGSALTTPPPTTSAPDDPVARRYTNSPR